MEGVYSKMEGVYNKMKELYRKEVKFTLYPDLRSQTGVTV
jgi:hypothetical protein